MAVAEFSSAERIRSSSGKSQRRTADRGRFGFREAKTDSDSNVNATNTRHPGVQIRNPLGKVCGIGRDLFEVKVRIAELIKM